MASPVADTYTAPTGTTVMRGGIAAPSGVLSLGNRRITIWGQSNAEGRADRADISASPLSSDAGLATFDSGTFGRVYIWTGAAYAQLQPSTNGGAPAGQFGPEFGLASRWMRETATGNLYLDKRAASGASITNTMFVPPGWPYSVGVDTRTAENTWLSTNSITLSGDAWVWIQGESDAAMAQATYQGHLSTLMAGLTTDGLRYTGTKDVLVQMAVGTAGYGAGVVAAKAAIAAADPTRTLTTNAPAYMKADNLHQNGRGQVQMAYNLFELLYSAPHLST